METVHAKPVPGGYEEAMSWAFLAMGYRVESVFAELVEGPLLKVCDVAACGSFQKARVHVMCVNRGLGVGVQGGWLLVGTGSTPETCGN